MVITATFESLIDMQEFAGFMAGKGEAAHPATAAPQPTQAQAPPMAPTAFAPAAPTQAAPGAQANLMQPAAPAQQPPAPVPTAERAYTLDELGRAGAALQAMGKDEEVRALVASFGVVTISELPESQYGAFAMAMRSMGAPI